LLLRGSSKTEKKGVAGDISTLMPVESCSLKDRLARAIERVAVFAVRSRETFDGKH